MWKHYLPDVKPYYAVKCNSDSEVLRWLGCLGAGFDCASGREMDACKFIPERDGKRIVFANPCKTPYDIEVARNRRIPWVTIDCCEELDKMKGAAYMPELLLRVAVDDSASDTPFSKKFGCSDWDEVKRLYQAALGLGFRVGGISFHVGSGCRDPGQYGSALARVDNFWGKLRGLGAKDLHTIDIGGGFRAGESYFALAAAAIKEGIQKLDAAKGAAMIAEPGRFFATPSHDLFVRVIGKKPGVGSKGWRYTIDESVYGQFSCIPFDGQKPPFARVRLNSNGGAPEEDKRQFTPAVIFGRTCDSLDVICYSSTMEELEIGDWLYFPWMGAYTTATSSEFNGFPKPQIIYTSDFVMPEVSQWPNTISESLRWQNGIEYALETRSKI
jgi:ornithine decarboxylase